MSYDRFLRVGELLSQFFLNLESASKFHRVLFLVHKNNKQILIFVLIPGRVYGSSKVVVLTQRAELVLHLNHAADVIIASRLVSCLISRC